MKRPSLELVDSHSFVTDEKDKNSKGPRIIETELSKSELIETVSKSTVEYASSTNKPSDDEEETTPLMEKLAIDLYAILANENAKEDDKKSKSDIDATTISSEDDLTTTDAETDKPTVAPSTTTTTKRTTTARTTTTTTEAPTTTTTEAPKRSGLSAGRNRFKLQSKTPTSTGSAAAAEVTTDSSKPKSRFSKPSSGFASRNSGARTTKASAATTAAEEAKENVENSEAPAQTSSKLGSKARNRFSLRTQPTTSTTEKPADPESSTVSRLLKPRPQFSLRNRGRDSPSTASTTESSDDAEKSTDEEKPVEKSSSFVPKPTSRLNLNRPGSRLAPGQKARTSPLSRGSSTNEESNDGNKSANENESDVETTTQNQLNKLKSRPRIQINAESKAKKTTSPAAVANRKVNPLISRRKFGVTSTTGMIKFLHNFSVI